MTYRIGVDGGGTKTECILVDADGQVVARHLAPGCNPSIVGPERARAILLEALGTLLAQAPKHGSVAIERSLLCLAGSSAFWEETARVLSGFGVVQTCTDAVPALELATAGEPGLVLHAGTGSFVAARTADKSVHYAGGLGWRLGDVGSGYEIGRRAFARAILELQGWAEPSELTPILTQLTSQTTAAGLTRFVYSDPDANRLIASATPRVLELATRGDLVAQELVFEACTPLLELAHQVAARLFSQQAFDSLRVGLSGPILNQPVVSATLAARTTLPLHAITESPIEGVRRLLVHGAKVP